MTQPATRPRFNMRVTREDDTNLRELAKIEGRPESAVVRDLVREAVAQRRAEMQDRWATRLFGTGIEEPPPGVA